MNYELYSDVILLYELYSDVILLQDIPEEGLSAGDVGTLVEKHQIEGLETGYSVEFFDMLGKSFALVTRPESFLRLPARGDTENPLR
ncbi:MAG: DUF4926 domain-containing protein [Microcystis aeruginosa G13-07]|jgi:hypothetical protein|nr:DUF4926 domain-containing protein [Microcystis aeruginosa W13-11]NCS03345.1 DUF4926 domain-containing protein [Microcystis aeruginosa G13-11]NCS07670.1 DUF4926 domain-containing protein [Microcystis aeruginosa G13-07]